MTQNTRKYDVFISYPHAQKMMADAVCATLEQAKIRCWIAPRDVLPGEPFAKAIIRAMNQSRLFVLIFSAETNESVHVKNEVERAVSKGLSIIVFRVQDVAPTDEMEFYLMRRHWLDAVTPPLEAHLQQLVEAVRVLLAMPTTERESSDIEQQVAALRTRAQEEAKKGNYEQAMSLLEQAEGLQPDDPSVAAMLQAVRRAQELANLRSRADECIAREDWDGALAALEQATRLAPDDASLHSVLQEVRRGRLISQRKAEAKRLADAEDWNGVVALLKQAQELAPDDEEIERLLAHAARAKQILELRERARTAFHARRWEQALRVLEELRAELPQDTEAREMLAVATLEYTRQQEMTELVKRAEASATKAREAVRKREWDAAERSWQEAATDWGAVVVAGEQYLAAAPQDTFWQTQVTEARNCQKDALQNARCLRRLAQAYADAQVALHAGQLDQAASLLSSIVEEMPGYRDASQLLRRARRGLLGRRLIRKRLLWIAAGALAFGGLVVLLLLSWPLLPVQTRVSSEEAKTLQQALAIEQVSVEAYGSGTGWGDCMTLKLTRRAHTVLALELPQGTLLLSEDPAVRDMVVMGVRATLEQDGNLTPTSSIRLVDDSPQEYLLEAYSLDHRLAVPTESDVFTVSGLADRAVRRVLKAADQLRGRGTELSPEAIQLALWLLDEDQDVEEFCAALACQPSDVALADQILVRSGVARVRPNPTPTPLPTPTVLVSAREPRGVSTPTPTITATETLTSIPTDTPTPTLTATTTSTPSPTETFTPTATRAQVVATPGPTPTLRRGTTPPAPPAVAALALQAPRDGEEFAGRTAKIKLSWAAAPRPLAPDEYYLVTTFFPHDQETWVDYQWTREPEIVLPEYLYDIVTGDRTFRWQVSVVRLNAGSPTGNPEGKTTVLGAPSAMRTFRWLLGSENQGPGGDGGAPPPTFTPRPPEPTWTPRP